MSRFVGCLMGALLVVVGAAASAAPLRVTAIQKVQGRDIPFEVTNGQETQLRAIAEDGNCGNAYRYRWDKNGDGDYDDGGEGWVDVNGNGFFAALHATHTYPDVEGNTQRFPKVLVECGNERVTATMPVL